jgi:RNA polymerase sigma factor (sigma-70 family)
MTSPHDTPDDVIARSILPGDMPDEARSLELLAMAQSGDEQALADLITRYQDRLRRIVGIQLAGSRLRRDLDSMDVVQGTFQAALPKIGELRPTSAASLLNWLAMIATNRIRDAYAWQTAAKRDVAREVTLDALGDTSRSAVLPEAKSASPAHAAMLQEVRALLDDAVALLPEDWRRVVLLRDYCGEDWERVAAELGRAVGAAKQLHQRAWIDLRRTLRPKLEGKEPERKGGGR